ncbi:MAG: PAS domain-containing protein [Coriobacteriia bacterium]|nr:PAS domain-containing protein [Coriobacteriia bacterium]
MRGDRKISVWPATLRGRFSASLALGSVLLFIVIYSATSLVTGVSPWPTATGNITDMLVPLGMGGLALASGFLLGLWLTSVISTPLERFADHIRQRGIAAIEGNSEDLHGELGVDVPAEFKELGDTVDQLLQQLSLRQAGLRAVTDRALDSERTFRAVVDASSEMKLLIRDDVIEIANPSAAAFLSQPVGALLGRPLAHALSPFTLSRENGAPLEPEALLSLTDANKLLIHCLAQDGLERWVECTLTHPREDSALSLLTVTDVTERRKLERLRAEVVSVVSHDLRAPLTVVSGYLEMLGGDLSTEQRDTVITKARAATYRMAQMLEDLLDAARAERGLLSNRRAPVPLGELATDVASSLPTHPDHELIIERHADAVIMGDADRLKQALTNLLMNAIKHTPGGTTISLRVDVDGDFALLVVEDGGDGVPAEYRELIFERYVRLDSDSDNGAGLGLYIVKTVAESHGGKAYVAESNGGGARFVIELPLESPRAD